MKSTPVPRALLPLFLSFCFFFLASCSNVSDTITDHPRKYEYQAGEVINFYDNTESRKLLGSLMFVSMHVLSEETYTKQNRTFHQIVQLNYVYNDFSGKHPGFVREVYVRDSEGVIGDINPDADYKKLAVSGMESLIVALENKSDSVTIKIYYSGFIGENANARLHIADNAMSPPQPTVKSIGPGQQKEKELSSLRAAIQNKEAEIRSLPDAIKNKEKEISSFQKELQSKDAEIHSLEAQKQNNEAQISSLKLPMGHAVLIVFVICCATAAMLIGIRKSKAKRHTTNTFVS